MYDVYIINDTNQELLHTRSLTSQRVNYKIKNAVITLGINAIDTFTFKIFPNNPQFNKLFSFSTKVIVKNLKNKNYDFYGRVAKTVIAMDSDGTIYKSITCESRLGYLCDTLTGYYPEQYWNVKNNTYNSSGTLKRRGVLEYIINLHNKKQPDEKKIYIGDVTIEDTNDELYFGMQQHSNAWTAIKEKLIEHLGGEIALRDGNDGKLYLDYKKEIGEVKSTRIALKHNMQKLNKEIDPTAFITRLYPLGEKIKKKVKNKDGTYSEVETDERITCANANNGIPYIDDEIGIKAYGIIEGYRIYDHVAKPKTLLNHGKVFLSENNKVKQKYVINALDLSLIGADIDSFDVGNYYPVVNKLIGIDDTLRVIKKTINLDNPEVSQLEIGDKYSTLTELEQKKKTDLKNELLSNISTVENNTNYNIEQNKDYLTSLINQFSDRIEQMIKEETVSVKDFNTYKKTVSTDLTQTKDSFNFTFKTVEENIKNLNGIVSTNQNTLVKYIRFEDGNIIFGIVGNEVLLKETNDRISFLQNDIEVAYISNNKLYITFAEFTNGIKVFDLSLTKESNDSYSLN